MQLTLLILMSVFFKPVMAATVPTVDPSEIQTAFETAFKTGSTATLVYTKDGISHYVLDQDEWNMMLVAQAILSANWKMQLEAPTYQITVGVPTPGPNTNTVIYPFKIHYSSQRFKAPICLDYTIDMEGNFDIYRSDDEKTQDRGIDLKSFTPRIVNEAQCV